MGAAVAAPKPSNEQFDPVVDGPSSSPNSISSVTSRYISSSFLYCLVQHAAEWPDYYVIVDLRAKASYDKGHIPGSIWIELIYNDLAEHLQSMIVAVVDHKPNSQALHDLLRRLDKQSVSPASVYVLNEPFSEFRLKYYFILSNFKPTLGQLPGPIEYVPRTKTTPAVYALQRNRYPMCKTLVAYLGCSKVLNLSAARLSVSIRQVTIENVCFDGTNEPYERAVSTLFDFAQMKQSNLWADNILVIDEPGSHFSALVTGWFLIEICGKDVDAVCQHMSNKSADLDPWYMNTLLRWAKSRSPSSSQQIAA